MRPLPDEVALGWLCLQQVPGLGPARLARLARTFDTPSAALAAAPAAWRQAGVPVPLAVVRRAALRARPQAEQWLARIKEIGGWTLAWSDAAYPERLREKGNPPPVLLFGLGRPEALSPAKSVAIIGTRRPTRAGLRMAEEAGRVTAAAGLTVVSGLARGIDGAAHRGAVQAGVTVAVLGSGLDIIYPPEHRRLAREIVAAGGAVITEYPPGTEPEPFRFPVRNRLISGLSDVVCVVEAGPRSGTIQTASRSSAPVVAWPGHPASPQSAFPRRLILEGAPPCADGHALIALREKLSGKETDQAPAGAGAGSGPDHSAAPGLETAPAERAWPPGPAGTVLAALAEAGEAGPAQLAAATALPLPAVLSVLMLLELQGHVMQLPGSRYAALRWPEPESRLAGSASL